MAIKFQDVQTLCANLPPKFVLSHYYELLGLIGWRAQLHFTVEEKITLLGIRNALMEYVNENKALPAYSRTWMRANNVADEAVNNLQKAGLLIEEGEILHKSKNYPAFYDIVKQTRLSAKRQVAWVIWYFYSNSAETITIQNFREALSYDDKSFLAELPDLSVLKKRKWVNVLCKSERGWLINEKPYTPSKAFFSLDITNRLFRVISAIGDKGIELSEEEILHEIRKQESEGIQRTAKSFDLTETEKGQWVISQNSWKAAGLVLAELFGICFWPYFADFTFENQYFKLGNHKAYVDLPNDVIGNFLGELEKISEKNEGNFRNMYSAAIDLKNEYNSSFSPTMGSSLKLVVRKEKFSKKKFGVQIKIDWITFFDFLNRFAQSDLALDEKYRYIYLCRHPLSTMKSLPIDDLRETVGNLVTADIEEISSMISKFSNSLDSKRNKIRRKALQHKDYYLMTLEYLPDINSSLRTIETCTKAGTLSPCYREMRKILENFSRVLFDDLMNLKLLIQVTEKGISSRTDGEVIRNIGTQARVDLKTLYNKYNRFVHSDTETLQLAPFSSMIEFKIFKFELSLFLNALLQTVSWYYKMMISSKG